MEPPHSSKICSSSVQNIPVIRVDPTHHSSKIYTLTSNVTSNITSNIKKRGSTPYNPPIDKNDGASPSEGKGNEVAKAEVRPTPTEGKKDIPAKNGMTRKQPEYSTESVEEFKKWLAHTPVAGEVAKIVNGLGCGLENRTSNMRLFFALIEKLRERNLRGNPYNFVLRILREDGKELAETDSYEFNQWQKDLWEKLDRARSLDIDTVYGYPASPAEVFAERYFWQNRSHLEAYCRRHGLAATKETAMKLHPLYRKYRDEFIEEVKMADMSKSIHDILFDLFDKKEGSLDAAS